VGNRRLERGEKNDGDVVFQIKKLV
jgi:hypothetical protein